MKVKLEEELQSISDQEKNKTVDEVKLLLAGDGAQDLHIMRHLANNSKLVKDEDTLGKQMDLEKKNLEYGKTFTIGQIEKLARKYHLRFLTSSIFKGKMDISTIAKIKAFAKEYNVSCLDESSLRRNFFILAPDDLFDLEVEYLQEAKEREHEDMIRELDPVLFYKIDDQHYRLIHKWGNDFTVLRRIKGYVYDNVDNYSRTMKLVSLTFFLLLGTVLYKTITHIAQSNNAPRGAGIGIGIGIVGVLVALTFSCVFYQNKMSYVLMNDSRSRPRKKVFGKTNWNSREILKKN